MGSPGVEPAVGSVASRAAGSATGWVDIERLVEDVSALARQATSPGDFYGPLLTRLVPLLTAVGGAVWSHASSGGFRLVCQTQLPDDFVAAGSRDAHGELLLQAVREGQPLRASWNAPAALELLLCPILLDGQAEAVIEIAERPAGSAASQQGNVRLLEAMCDLAGEFHRNRQLAELRQWRSDAARVEDYLQQVHRSLDLPTTCYAIANEGRRLLGCDRVSVLVRHRRCYRVAAVSGIDLVDRRSALVRTMEQFAGAVLATGEPACFNDNTADLPPEWERLLHALLDESRAREVAVLPLRIAEGESAASAQVPGALVVERFTSPVEQSSNERRKEVVLRHGALALQNALEYRRVPFFPIVRRVSSISRAIEARLPLTAVVAAAVALAAVLLTILPADFRVEARGELQPELRRDVFAPADGVVQQVYVEHAQTVAAGDLLLEMRQTELDFEFARVLGELQTAGKQLEGIQATRLSPQRSEETEDRSEDQLTSEEEELKKRVAGLEEQRTVLVDQKDELRVKSPLSGQVVSWEVNQTLLARPVQRGQALLTIVDPHGPWILELHVPDRDIGHVLAARQSIRPDLSVSFLLATDPANTYRGKIQSVALGSETDENRQASVRVTVQVESDVLPQRRPGATVSAAIDCGRRPLVFVWFHDLWEMIQTYVLF